MANGGNFGSGFVGGAVGNMAGEASTGAGMLESAGIAGLASGATSWASGGDFATGFQAGANNVLYNKWGDGVKKMAKDIGNTIDKALNISGDLASTAQVLGKSMKSLAIDLKAESVGRFISAAQIGQNISGYKSGKISISEAFYRSLLPGASLFSPPGRSIFINHFFQDNNMATYQ